MLHGLSSPHRDAVAECSEVAYRTLSVSAAKRSLLLSSDAALAAYAEEKHPDWIIEGSVIKFVTNLDKKQAKASDVPSDRLISEALSYATEIERIV